MARYQSLEPCFLENSKKAKCSKGQRCYHHILKRQRSTPIDEPWNWMSTCFNCHEKYWERKSRKEMSELFPELVDEFKLRGFWQDADGKWRHCKDTRHIYK